MSDDAGASWKLINDNRNLRQRAFYYTRIYADPEDKDTVYVLNVQFFRSTDGGKTTTNIRVPHGDNHDLWISPTDNKRMIQANDGGANVSVNGGADWTDQDYPTGQFYNVFTTRHVPYHICGAQQDNSTACVGSQANRRRRGQPAANLLCGRRRRERLHRARSERPQRVLRRQLRRLPEPPRSRDRPAARDQHLSEQSDGPLLDDIKERFQWTFPIVFSPIDPKMLYASSQHVWRTTNDGQSWERISPNLARSDPKTMQASGGPITKDQTGVETYAVVFTHRAVAAGRQHDLDGSDDGLVHVTRDGGKNWEQGHAARSAGVRAHQPDRSVAAPERRRVSRGQSLPARRSHAVRLQDRRLRQDLDEDRHRHSRHRLRARDSRRHQAPRPALRRHRARHLRLVQRRRRRGSRCS